MAVGIRSLMEGECHKGQFGLNDLRIMLIVMYLSSNKQIVIQMGLAPRMYS